MSGKSGGNAKKHGRWKRTPSNVSYSAQDRCAKNKRRKAAKVMVERRAKVRHENNRADAGKPSRGNARRARRSADLTAWRLSGHANKMSLAVWMHTRPANAQQEARHVAA